MNEIKLPPLRVVSYLAGRHPAYCAVHDPCPGNCDCDRKQEPLVLLADVQAAILSDRQSTAREHRGAEVGKVQLTDDRIEDLRAEANRRFNIERDDYFKAFRDAERVHGIGAGNAPVTAHSGAGDARKSLNAECADLLRPYLKPGQKVIWREAFRWHDDNGVLSNHYDGMELEQLAEDFKYDWSYEFNFKHAAIVAAISAQAAGGVL